MINLAHVVFYVRDLKASVAFYSEIVGLSLVGKIFNERAAMLTGGSTHHELLLIQVGEIGDDLETLRLMRDRLTAANYSIDGMSDHTVSQSIYLRDPDGNEVELFVDNPTIDWKNNREWMEEPVKPLKL